MSLFEQKLIPIGPYPIQQIERHSEELYKMKDLCRQKEAGTRKPF